MLDDPDFIPDPVPDFLIHSPVTPDSSKTYSGLFERIAKLELQTQYLVDSISPIQEQLQQSFYKQTKVYEKISVHLENESRMWARVQELESSIVLLEKEVHQQTTTLVELKEQQRNNMAFIDSVKRGVGLLAITVLGVTSWLFQRWIEHGR